MVAGTDNYLLLRAFVDELARCGMRAACSSPGSRCAPLVLTLARESRVRCFSHLDERCAGFFALGLAKASGIPVAVACTSGTAVGELVPAAIEAHEARVPLLLLTADRPPELRENGAGQAIDQFKLFGSSAKWFFEVEVDEASSERLRWIRTLACRAYWGALEGGPGVVHLNFPLREPLVSDDPLPLDESARPDGSPYVRRGFAGGQGALPRSRPVGGEGQLLERIAAARRGVLVAGRHERGVLGESAAAFCEAAGWPLLADPLSGARLGHAAIAHYDALLREQGFLGPHRPDLVLRVGDLPVSKPLRTWLAGLGNVRQIALGPEGAWQDPAAVLSDSFALEPATALEQARALLGEAEDAASEPDWLSGWRSADELAAEAILATLRPTSEAGGELSEPAVAAELGVLLPQSATLFVASSMPVRDIEAFWPVRPDPPRVLCNRGASGVDGTVSSAFGAAAHGEGPLLLLIGDVALAHDIGGLLAARRLGLKLTIVLLDNGGGGIFDFLPVSRAPMGREVEAAAGGGIPADGELETPLGSDIYTRHVATPTGLDFAKAAALYELSHTRVRDLPEFRAALERELARSGAGIIEVAGSRTANVELHERVWEAVSLALNPPAAGGVPPA
jgi:2-succinyl-5-enolpyruvyl-6-hydroxy-3-cyclohexene-1-carboxylate synthase